MEDIQEALASLRDTIVTSSRDYSLHQRDAWIYHIAVGWPADAWAEVRAKHASWWGEAATERLERLAAAARDFRANGPL